MNLLYIAAACALLGLGYAFVLTGKINKVSEGTERMKEIASAIAEGARAFLFAEYKILAIFAVALFVLLFVLRGMMTAVCFILGALLSVIAGYCGMNVATKANVRTAAAAMESGMNKALSVAFSGITFLASNNMTILDSTILLPSIFADCSNILIEEIINNNIGATTVEEVYFRTSPCIYFINNNNRFNTCF